MNLIHEEGEKKIFADDNKVYTMIDMGNYIGHKHRNWYEIAPEKWRLMFYDEKRENDEDVHIHALVEPELGDYIRISISKGNCQRLIQLKYGCVYNDVICEYEEADVPFPTLTNEYIFLDGDVYSQNKIPLDEYISFEPTFIDKDKKEYNGEFCSNKLLSDFVNSNYQLQEKINNNVRAK